VYGAEFQQGASRKLFIEIWIGTGIYLDEHLILNNEYHMGFMGFMGFVGFMGFMGFMGYDNKSIVDNDTMIYDN
jgi:hypothetical protein